MKVRTILALAAAAAAVTLSATGSVPATAGEPIGGASSVVCNETATCETHATVTCKARAFPWGGECWSRGEGRAFERWLTSRGASPQAFRKRHPELARIFTQPWPAPRPWVNCSSAACVPAVIEHVFGSAAGYATAIARCETGGTFNPWALGAAGERGIFQIHPVHFGWLDEERLWEPLYNSRIAFRMSRGGTSWGPWTCARLV